MAALPLTNVIAPPVAAVDPAASKTGGHQGAEFLSLLDIASAKTDEPRADTPDDADDRDRRYDTPAASPADAPKPVVSAPKVQADIHAALRASEPRPHSDSDRPAGDSNDDAKAAQPSARPAGAQLNADSRADDKAAAPAADGPAQDTKGKPVSVQPPQAQNEPPPSSDDDVRDAISAQLGSIEQILAAVIQALTGTVPQQAAAVPSTDGVPTGTAVIGAVLSSTPAPAAVPSASLPAVSAPAAPSAAGAAGSVTQQEIGLLNDMRSLLQQMQQILAGGEAPHQNIPVLPEQAAAPAQAPVFQNGQDTLLQLADLLQSDIGQLGQLLAQQGSAETPPGTARTQAANIVNVQPAVSSQPPAGPQPAPVSPLAALLAALPAAAAAPGDAPADTDASQPSPQPQPLTIASLIRDSIADIRGKLQKLNNQNTGFLARLQDDIRTQFAQARQFFKDAGTSDAVTDTTAKTAAAQAVIADTAATASGAAIQPAISQNSNAASIPQAVPVNTGVSAAQAGSDSGSNASGYNNQDQAPAPLTGAGTAGQPQGVAAGAASFARALEQQAAPPPPLPEQISFHIKAALNDGSSKIRIQLDPADLGKVDIKLHVGADGKTGVVITADNRGTLDLLQRDAQNLARALNDAGLSTDTGSLSFNLRDQQQGQGNNQQASGSYQKMQPQEEEELNLNVLTRSYVVNVADGLDITI